MSKTRCLISASSAALVVSGFMLAVPLVGWAQLEEIVVTTRKKTENLQDVPIAVDTITAEQIARQGIVNMADVTKMSTSVQFDQSYGPQDVRIAVRGLSNTRGRSNVAFLIDGVDVTTENFSTAGSGLLANQRLLTDIERIEIVKGPQSALYGRAAFAGAISYTTRDVGDELAHIFIEVHREIEGRVRTIELPAFSLGKVVLFLHGSLRVLLGLTFGCLARREDPNPDRGGIDFFEHMVNHEQLTGG